MGELFKDASAVTHAEAAEIAARFIHRQFGVDGTVGTDGARREGPRASIPVNAERDDDVRLGLYIERCERLEAAAVRLAEAATAAPAAICYEHGANGRADCTECADERDAWHWLRAARRAVVECLADPPDERPVITAAAAEVIARHYPNASLECFRVVDPKAVE